MKVISDSFSIQTSDHVELKNISSQVQDSLKRSDLKDGIITIFTRHTTSGIIINEDERGLVQDFINFMKKLVPKSAGYKHDRIDNNAHSHLQATLVPCSVTVPFKNGILELGTWQSIFFFEFDGPRSRTILIKIIGE
ncbi:MAG: secondary thiamine-phosphate synthase enzyme YjbQ [Candidatus Helarchaeota archaeon]